MADNTEVEALAELVSPRFHFQEVRGIPVGVRQAGHKLETLERLGLYPRDFFATPLLYDAQSFIDYWERFQEERSVVFRNTHEHPKFEAIFDYHHGNPGWCRHRATYIPTLSREWRDWMDIANVELRQLAWMEFVEDHVRDIQGGVEGYPDAADMLEAARTLQATQKATYKSARRLETGDVEFHYETTTAATTRGGQQRVPQHFILAIPVFEGDEKAALYARLRFRMLDGTLTLMVVLDRPDLVQRKTYEELADRIRKGTVGDGSARYYAGDSHIERNINRERQ